MACYPRGYGEPAARPQTAAGECGGNGCNLGQWSCIVNLIVILIVLEFLSSLLGNVNCGAC